MHFNNEGRIHRNEQTRRNNMRNVWLGFLQEEFTASNVRGERFYSYVKYVAIRVVIGHAIGRIVKKFGG